MQSEIGTWNTIEAHVVVDASPSVVWRYLTEPALMKQWMGEEELKSEVLTDWSVGSRIVVRAFHHEQFENSGTVLEFEPNSILRYTQLSSLSGLEDKDEHYSVFTFLLEPENGGTNIKLSITNFPNDTIRKHLELYWRVTIQAIKVTIEENEVMP